MLKLEEGKYYRTRDGRKAGPLEAYFPDQTLREGLVGGEKPLRLWRKEDGKHRCYETEIDLVAEWVEETTMDIYSLEKPLGMYPQEVRDALIKHHDGGGLIETFNGKSWGPAYNPLWVLYHSYRAVKKPEVREVVMYTTSPTDSYFGETADTCPHDRTHKITFNIVDGVPDCNSIRMEKL